ncbi:hypothetical protein KKG31_02550, partial [Patescibacteria group bacterium]|nr:hypothetical protein [Patescibacteria group bacterium]
MYNPYKNPGLVMGEFTIRDSYDNPVVFSGDVRDAIVSKISSVLDSSDISDKKNDNSFIKFLKGITSFTINIGNSNIQVEYTNGRKDAVLTRMYEDGYISDEEIKAAFIQGLEYEFQSSAFPITAPHFVQW